MNTGRKTSGQSLIEFALLLPLFLFLVMGLFEIGRAVLYFSVLNTAVREGTRVAIVQPSKDYIVDGFNEGDRVTVTCDQAQSDANKKICNTIYKPPEETGILNWIAELSSSTITIQHLDNDETNPTEFFVRIDISFNFSPITPGLELIGPFPINVSSQMIKTPLSRP